MPCLHSWECTKVRRGKRWEKDHRQTSVGLHGKSVSVSSPHDVETKTTDKQHEIQTPRVRIAFRRISRHLALKITLEILSEKSFPK